MHLDDNKKKLIVRLLQRNVSVYYNLDQIAIACHNCEESFERFVQIDHHKTNLSFKTSRNGNIGYTSCLMKVLYNIDNINMSKDLHTC